MKPATEKVMELPCQRYCEISEEIKVTVLGITSGISTREYKIIKTMGIRQPPHGKRYAVSIKVGKKGSRLGCFPNISVDKAREVL